MDGLFVSPKRELVKVQDPVGVTDNHAFRSLNPKSFLPNRKCCVVAVVRLDIELLLCYHTFVASSLIVDFLKNLDEAVAQYTIIYSAILWHQYYTPLLLICE